MLFLGIDIGTTGTKSILTDEKANIIMHSYKGYGLATSNTGWVEQNPLDWWEAVKFTVRECFKNSILKDDLRGIAVSAQGGSLLVMDQNGEVSGNAISWLDTRAKKYREEFIKNKGNSFFHTRTGLSLMSGLPVLNIRWLKDNNPELFLKASAFYTTLDYINLKLTGKAVIDPSCAALTQMLNVKDKCWDEEILSMLGIGRGKLPLIINAGSTIGKLTRAASEELGLPMDIDVVCGGLDQNCMALGSGAVNDGDMILSTGTAWVLLALTSHLDKIDNPAYSIIPHVIQGKWGILGSIPSAGASLDWLREKVLCDGGVETYNEMDSKIEKCEPGAKGMMMVPFFAKNSGNMMSRITGLTLAHDRYDVLRVYMESIGYEVKKMIDELGQEDLMQKGLKVTGGASRSRVWMSIISSILNRTIVLESNSDAACIGAAMLAAMGTGVFKAADDCRSRITPCRESVNKLKKHIEPVKQMVDTYKTLYEKYLQNRCIEG